MFDFDDKFEKHMQEAEVNFPSVLALKEKDNIHEAIDELASIFEVQSGGKSPLETLPRLIALHDKLAEAIEESITNAAIRDLFDRAKISGKARTTVSIAEGPINFFKSLKNAIGGISTTTAIGKLASKLREWSAQLKNT